MNKIIIKYDYTNKYNNVPCLKFLGYTELLVTWSTHLD